jgi:hypothetical protein
MAACEQHALKSVAIVLKANISFYWETTGGQNSNLYLNAVNTSFY